MRITQVNIDQQNQVMRNSKKALIVNIVVCTMRILAITLKNWSRLCSIFDEGNTNLLRMCIHVMIWKTESLDLQTTNIIYLIPLTSLVTFSLYELVFSYPSVNALRIGACR